MVVYITVLELKINENWSASKEVAISNGTLVYIRGMILRKTRFFSRSSNLIGRFRG